MAYLALRSQQEVGEVERTIGRFACAVRVLPRRWYGR
jgi:hypothetical protein